LPWHERAARFGWKSTAAIPLHLRGKTIGALTIYDDVSDVFDEEVRRLFVEMEKTIGFALDHFENAAERKEAEELLRSSEERYRKLVDNLDAGVVMHGPDTSVITSNPRALELLGLSEDQMAGRRAVDPEWKFLHEDHAPFLLQEFPVSRIIAEKKAIKNLVLRIVRPMSKDIVWVSVNGVPVFDQQGDILQVVVSFVDITERKQAEEALQESEKRMRAITDSAQDAIVMMDPEGRICYWNAAAERIFGYTSEEALGGNLHALIAPARYHAAQNAAFPAFLKSGQGNAVGKTLEMEALHKDGSEMSVELSLSAIQVQGDWHAVGFIRDITERKAMELALASTRDRLLLATKAGGVGIWDWDIVNNSLLWDDQMYLQYGITQDQFGGAYEAWAAGVHPEDKMRGDAEIQMAFRGEKEFDTEFRVLWPDGTIRNIRALALVQRDASGKPLRMIGTNWDITEIARTEKELKIALERAEAGNRAKSEFLNVMSHELRTPLNGVLGFAQLLSDTLLDNEQKSFAKTISQSGEHLLAIVNDILDFASIDAGTLAIHWEPLVVAELVKSSEQAVIKSAMEKGISLQSIIEPNLPKEILGDDQRIRQILINLLGNAVKFTASGSVTLRVATLIEGGRQFLDFSVEDTGIGMLPETLGILFNPFKQADMRMNRTFGGAGLGLAISQRLAEAMDGKITVVSTVGKGSTFTFRLPIKKSAPYELNDISPNLRASGTESIAQERVLPGTGENRTAGPVLVVEDDKTNSMLAGKMLESLGYQVEFAADGAEALDAFVPGKYSAILMDIQMPVMNGLEATGKIRELESGTRVPIIALTAKVMPGDRERCLAAGMDDFLSKPFKKDELAAKLACAAQIS
jgi:PAS domain S-box-containing protein